MSTQVLLRTVIKNVLLIVVVFAVSFNLHQYLLNNQGTTLAFSLFDIYLFHCIASCLVYSIIELLAMKLPDQAGFGYLATTFVKVGVFVLLFQHSVFDVEVFKMSEKLALVIPLFVFLFVEVYLVARLLNAK
ncbi:DUF6168 family protein [Mangrovimonas aestuarii]|uniref:DUF6168 family protein n=1 Tax=Mangrovimonas aestuarii TaxID=3018443 RepID=UPI002378B5EF|nr:DUF6168 family protein [Mangrovimonas aestuarii]